MNLPKIEIAELDEFLGLPISAQKITLGPSGMTDGNNIEILCKTARLLSDFYIDGAIIEIGTHQGLTALNLANNITEPPVWDVITIDIAPQCQLKHPLIRQIVGDSRNPRTWRFVRKFRATMIYIDGDHSRSGVLCDSLNAVFAATFASNSWIFWHDVHNKNTTGQTVTRALEDLEHAFHWGIHKIRGTWLAVAKF